MTRLRPLFGIALGWAALWLAFWTIVGVVIGVVDPDSIDPGEGWMMVVVLGPMGLFSGVAFGLLLSVGARGKAHTELPVLGVAARGPYRGARAVSADVRAGPSSESSTAERRDTGTT